MKMNIESDPKVLNLIQKRDLAEQTELSYMLHIRHYCEFQKMTPSELIKEAREDQVKQPWMDDRHIQSRLIKYNQHIEKQFTYKTRKLAIGVIRTFYNEYQIALPKVKIKQDLEEAKKDNTKKIPTIDHIKEAVEIANKKYKAIILLLATSGMGINEMRHLTLQDYYNALGLEEYDPSILTELDKHVYTTTIPSFNVFRRKTRIQYTTFCTPEAMDAINNYLFDEYSKERPPADPETSLFVPFQKFKNNTGLIARNSIARYFQKINRKMGWGKSGRYVFFHPHTLRRFFATTLTANRIPELYVHWFLGHKADPVTDAYFKPAALKEEYRRVIPYLSIEKVNVRTLTDERLQSLEDENKQIKEDLEHFKKMLSDKQKQEKLV